ncbi:hypothetical protein FB45DRAFT_388970 [Roridomyces roridus]|uniref:NACHT domain-containing protein n=1 Tax=Roridomyces roridus TaxID=1738132 RepID=A0AAD7B262_9AGAR|nr:hypothetical protein FB45DRAFT_388970 [Roridomyces roridus]
MRRREGVRQSINNIYGGTGGRGGAGGTKGGEGGTGQGASMSCNIDATNLRMNNTMSASTTSLVNHISGDVKQFNVWPGVSGLDLLYRSVVKEGVHDSWERADGLSCHPGTRIGVLDKLGSWADETTTPILWLHGPAGVGKSAIVKDFAVESQARGRLGAAFFFRLGQPTRGTWHGLFPTLAYQLAILVPALSDAIHEAVDQDRLIDGRAMSVQFERLLVDPFRQTPAIRPVPLLILDGLDECADYRLQQQIILLFETAIRTSVLPIRLLISSRSEPHLRQIFEKSGITRGMELTADADAFKDIGCYLRDEFSRIKRQASERGLELADTWPPPHALTHLVEKSSATFFFAAVIVRFIDHEYSHPADRLQRALALDPCSTVPLDDLYLNILSACRQEPEQLLRILHAIWRNSTVPILGPEDIDSLLCLRLGTSRLALRGLHSIIYVPPKDNAALCNRKMAFLHDSLADFLYDERRSNRWCIARPSLASEYLECVSRVHLCTSPLQLQDASLGHQGRGLAESLEKSRLDRQSLFYLPFERRSTDVVEPSRPNARVAKWQIVLDAKFVVLVGNCGVLRSRH